MPTSLIINSLIMGMLFTFNLVYFTNTCFSCLHERRYIRPGEAFYLFFNLSLFFVNLAITISQFTSIPE